MTIQVPPLSSADGTAATVRSSDLGRTALEVNDTANDLLVSIDKTLKEMLFLLQLRG